MKNLSYTVEGKKRIPDWTDRELRDVFIEPNGAKEYKDILAILESEYKRLGTILDGFSGRSKEAFDVSRAADLYRRILFFKIQELKRADILLEEPGSSSSNKAVTVKDLQNRYGIKSRQGITTWISRNLDVINRQAADPVRKVGKYWIIPASALPIIDSLRRSGKER